MSVDNIGHFAVCADRPTIAGQLLDSSKPSGSLVAEIPVISGVVNNRPPVLSVARNGWTGADAPVANLAWSSVGQAQGASITSDKFEPRNIGVPFIRNAGSRDSFNQVIARRDLMLSFGRYDSSSRWVTGGQRKLVFCRAPTETDDPERKKGGMRHQISFVSPWPWLVGNPTTTTLSGVTALTLPSDTEGDMFYVVELTNIPTRDTDATVRVGDGTLVFKMRQTASGSAATIPWGSTSVLILPHPSFYRIETRGGSTEGESVYRGNVSNVGLPPEILIGSTVTASCNVAARVHVFPSYRSM